MGFPFLGRSFDLWFEGSLSFQAHRRFVLSLLSSCVYLMEVGIYISVWKSTNSIVVSCFIDANGKSLLMLRMQNSNTRVPARALFHYTRF